MSQTLITFATILGTLVAALSLLAGWINNQRKALMQEIRRSVDEVVKLLTEKLETKERVADLAQKVAVLSAKIDAHKQHSDRS